VHPTRHPPPTPPRFASPVFASGRTRACTLTPDLRRQPKDAQALPKPSDAWTARVWTEFRAGNLTRACRDVLLTLQTFRGHGGEIHPSHATLAERARCSPRTVLRALRTARALGLVSYPGSSGGSKPPGGGSEARTATAWRCLPRLWCPIRGRSPLTARLAEEGRASKTKRLGRGARQSWRSCWTRLPGCRTCWRCDGQPLRLEIRCARGSRTAGERR